MQLLQMSLMSEKKLKPINQPEDRLDYVIPGAKKLT